MNRKFLIFGLLVCITYVSCQNKINVFQTVKGDDVDPMELDSFIQHQIDSLEVAGLSIAIIRDNKIVYENAFGYKNLATKEECTTETIYETYSLSKPMFAYFVMLQVEKGILDLDRPLFEYLPNDGVVDDERYKTITARMVLCHTSGLPNWRENTGGKLA